MRCIVSAMLGTVLVFGSVASSAPAVAQAGRFVGDRAPESNPRAIIVYTAPTSATWGPSAGTPPTFAFGKPAEVLLVVPGGYVVRQELPLEQAIAHATYVSGQVGQAITVTIPDPAGGPARIEYVDTARNDR